MNQEWIESLPKTPPETENDNLSENEELQMLFSSTYYNIKEEEEEEEEGPFDVDVDIDIDSYGSDNDDINSDDELYDVIAMDESIHINLTQDEIDKFNEQLYAYYDNTRASKKLCCDRYNILCLINSIWQKVLIQREFDKNNYNMADYEIINDKIADSNDIEINCDENGEWLTPCCAPQERLKLMSRVTGEVVYDKLIPSARIFGSICTQLDGEESDMDITLPNSVANPNIDIWFNKNEQKSKLSAFLNIFLHKNKKSQSQRFQVFPILNAKVPIIKMNDVERQIEVDIAIESSQQSVANLINFYCDYDDRVRPFIITIKHWSRLRCLCDAMNNYPNSFGFVLLSIKYLQMVNILPIAAINNESIAIIKDINVNSLNRDTLLQLLCQFFEMYRRFNFKLLQISTSRIGLESKICHEYYSNFKYKHQTTMVVEDPSCRSANVTRNVRPYRLAIMQNEFFRAYICVVNGDWDLLMTKYTTNSDDIPVFDKYPAIGREQQLYEKKLYSNSQQYTKEKDKEKGKEKQPELHVIDESELQNKLNLILSDQDIKIFIKLTPFKINGIKLNQLINIKQFIEISKLYVIQFNIQFIKYYHNNHNNLNNNKLFDILSIHNSMKEIIEYNNNENCKLFVDECNELEYNKTCTIMPFDLYKYIFGQYNLNNSKIYNYSWYMSFISLSSFWNCVFDDYYSYDHDIIHQFGLLNKECIVSKMKTSMVGIGLTHLTETQLFELLN